MTPPRRHPSPHRAAHHRADRTAHHLEPRP